MLVGGGKGGAGCKTEGSSRCSQKSEYPSIYVLRNHRILRNEQRRGLEVEGEEIAKKTKNDCFSRDRRLTATVTKINFMLLPRTGPQI